MVRVESHGDELSVEVKGDFTIKTPIKIKVSSPILKAVKLAGAVDATLASAIFGDFDGRIEGASRLSVSGEADVARWQLSGAGQLRAVGLMSMETHVNASGAAEVEVAHLKKAVLKVGGAAEATLHGGGNLTIEASGAAKVFHQDGLAAAATVDSGGASSVELTLQGKGRFESGGASSILCLSDDPSLINSKSSPASSIKIKAIDPRMLARLMGASPHAMKSERDRCAVKQASLVVVEHPAPAAQMAPAQVDLLPAQTEGLMKVVESMNIKREATEAQEPEPGQQRPSRSRPVG